jgi:ribonucleotide reductase class II
MLDKSLAAPLVYNRTYSRRTPSGRRELWIETVDRAIKGLAELGKLTIAEIELIRNQHIQMTSLTSGRWLWVGGTEWASKPENYQGAYNCSNIVIDSFDRMAHCMDLLMQGCGVGTIIETDIIDKLPEIKCKLNLEIIGHPGQIREFGFAPIDETRTYINPESTTILVGDSRQGWVEAYKEVLKQSAHNSRYLTESNININIGQIRAAGDKIEGFGGVANPVGLPKMFTRMVEILNGAVGRKLNSVEVCLLLDEPALAVVAGNVRRSANIRQFSSDDDLSQSAKDNLWTEDELGNWSIDPKRDAVRMSNHTRVFHYKPSLEDCINAVRKQYYSGEGAIQWAGEAIARGNADLLDTNSKKSNFLNEYDISKTDGRNYIEFLLDNSSLEVSDKTKELNHRMMRYGTNPCGEVVLNDNFCNLSEVHLNLINPFDVEAQKKAFKAAAISASSLLHHQFVDEKMQYSREIDPIVGVSFTGLFDFFVNLFGVDWLRWWQAGRPSEWNTKSSLIANNAVHNSNNYHLAEQYYLSQWRLVVEDTVREYCDRHKLNRPNRYTTVQPAGTKSLLTGASPGWHPPKAARFIRRITLRREDPVALAAMDCGYSVIPSQTDKDENGSLLNDPFDLRCTEWLVEVPIAASWADLDGVDEIDISKFSALAQMDFYLQVQRYYTTHNTSATIEFTRAEIEPLATRIYEAIRDDEGYISAALLARFDDLEIFPRLPFEPIDKATYDRLVSEMLLRRTADSFDSALASRDMAALGLDNLTGPIACDSDKCLMPERKDR